jgi:hypothetical protein
LPQTSGFSVGNEYYLELKEQFKRFAEEKYQSQDVNIEVVLVERGNPVKTILLIAEKNDCDMIIMGGRGHDSQEDLALGNTVAGRRCFAPRKDSRTGDALSAKKLNLCAACIEAQIINRK